MMLERDWQQTVTDTAEALGWRVYHTYDSRRSHAGYPDLTLVHRAYPALIFAELKTDKGQVSQQQHEWLVDLERIAERVRLMHAHDGITNVPTIKAAVWRPSDWPTVERTLRNPQHR